MFAEISAILGILNTVNSAISTIKEANGNAADAASILGKFSDANLRLNAWEKKTKVKRPLTPKEAMDLTLARRKIEATDRALKDACLMSGCADVYQEMKRVQWESEQNHKKYMQNVIAKRRARRKKMEQYTIAIGLVIIVILGSVVGWGGYKAYSKYENNSEKNRLSAAQERQKNIRQCGRSKC